MKKNNKQKSKLFARTLVALLCLVSMMLVACGTNANDKTDEQAKTDDVTVRIGSLKGPTSIGLVNLMNASEDGSAKGNYEFTMETGADTILASMMQGNLDIALVPANVASVLFNKTEGKISVIDINTLGVLYMISGDDSIATIGDLSGKTVYLTGKGTTPDFVLQYLLDGNEVSNDVSLEYMSEATEVLNAIVNEPNSVGLLPQPFATAALVKNENLKQVIDMTESWNSLQGDDNTQMVTGVTVVRNEFLAEHEGAVKLFMEEHRNSAEMTNSQVEATAALVEKYGIIEKAPIAQKAIPLCNITYIDGEEMKMALSGYLAIINQYDSAFIGGALPTDNFYYSK